MSNYNNVVPLSCGPANDPLLTTRDAAALAGVKPETLCHQRWRRRTLGMNSGPLFETLNGRPMYLRSVVLAFYGEGAR